MQHKNPQKSRRKYDASFKAEVVSMIATGRSVPDMARSGIGEDIIYRWLKKALEGPGAAAGTSDCSTSSQVSLSEHLTLQRRFAGGGYGVGYAG